MATPLVLTARWIFTANGPPLEGGIVVIDGDTIFAVEPHRTRAADLDLGNCAILPGLVNAHTHLDLSGLQGRLPPSSDFVSWLKGVIAHRRSQTPEQVEADVRVGLEQAIRFGTTLLCDISGNGTSFPILKDAPLWSIVFREMIGLRSERVPMVWEEAVRWRDECPVSARCRPGWSPHAPYSVHAAILRKSTESGTPVCIHLAETRAELQLLESRTGPFVEFLQELGVWEPDSLIPSIGTFFQQSHAHGPLLFVHGNYLSADAPIPQGATIVYCPRTHAAFGHDTHPFRELLARGHRVVLGTDSTASNPDVDPLAEARFLHQHFPDFPDEELLRIITRYPAEATGWGHLTGSVEPGKSADLVAIPLPSEESANPYSLLWGGVVENQPRWSMWRGILRQST